MAAADALPADGAAPVDLTLTTFQDSFSASDLLNSLSERLIASSSAAPPGAPFDPLPFLRTFTDSLDSLLMIRAQAQTRTERLEAEVRKAEKEYGKRLGELDRGFDAVHSSFADLSTSITDLTSPTLRIGDLLSTLHASRSKAQSTTVLLSYYLALAAGDRTPLDKLLADARREGREGREGRMRAAVTGRRLLSLVKADDGHAGRDAIVGGGEDEDDDNNEQAEDDSSNREMAKVRVEVEDFGERFEKDVLSLFDRYYRRGDPKMMGHCARVLLEFNGGASCVQVYVNQHDFFISRDRIGGGQAPAADDADFWRTLPDPLRPAPRFEPTLKALFDDIRATVKDEAQIIRAVFPNPGVVMQVFLQRVFAQVVQQHLEALLDRASATSTLASLRLLHIAHRLTTALAEDLKAFDFAPAVSNSSVGGVSGEATIGQTLDACVDETFAPYLEGKRYLDRERKSLGELYGGFLLRFTRYHEMTHKAKPNGLFDRVVNQLATASTSSASSQTTQAAAAAILKYSGVEKRAGEKEGELRVQQTDGETTVELGDTILRWHAEALGRCVELSGTSDVPRNALELARVLSEALGRSYIETSLDSALSKLDASDPRLEPDLSALATIKTSDLLCALWQRYATTALAPLVSSAVGVRRELSVLNQANVARIEAKVNAILHRLLDALLGWLSTLLLRQRKDDFKPRNDDASFERVNTVPCAATVDVLDRVRAAVSAQLTGKNAESFLIELGVGFHSLLLDHLRKFPVSVTGALMLTKDLASYQECFAGFGVTLLNERFAMLRQLGNLFVVQPEVLKSFMAESYLGQIEPHLLRPYLAQRVDYPTFARRFAEDEGFGIDKDAPVPSASARSQLGAVDRLSALGGQALAVGKGRLTGMMDELGAFSATLAGGGAAGDSNASRPPASSVALNDRIAANREARAAAASNTSGRSTPVGRATGPPSTAAYFTPMPM